ncbi:MAG: PilW family protein [Sedimentibacter sp.]
MKRNQNGFTLIELLITLGIMSFITAMVFGLFIINFNNYVTINNDSRLQFQSQYILNFVSNKIMESKCVEVILTGTSSLLKAKSEYSISKISLRYGIYNHNCFIFEVRNNKIYYGNSFSYDSADVELGIYVKELKVAPYPEGKTFAESSALKITLYLISDGQEYVARQIVYMRNS